MLLFEGPQGCCCSKALRGVAVRRPSGVLLFKGPPGCCYSKALRGVAVRRPSGVLMFKGPQGCCRSKALRGVATQETYKDTIKDFTNWKKEIWKKSFKAQDLSY